MYTLMSSKAKHMDATSGRIMELDPIFHESTSPKQEDQVTIVELDRDWQSCERSLATFLNVYNPFKRTRVSDNRLR